MLLTILFGIILIVGIIFVILYNTIDNSELNFGVGLLATLLGGVGLFTTVLLIICVNSTPARLSTRAKLTNTVVELSTTYNILIEKDRTLDVYTAIDSYNSKVSEYKTEVTIHQEYLKNPWINWFVCAEYNNFNVDAVSYIDR